ncbi:MAG: pirin family protein [Myxococcota bacterium]
MSESIELLIHGRERDLGSGMKVSRVLPYVKRRAVGPFIFIDRMGPNEFGPGQAMDVRPHPHIGLATMTYMFEGAGVHRDSLGVVQEIHPGDINWMTAGRGIVHSERSRPQDRSGGVRMDGLQNWIALPREHEETEPNFIHHPRDTLPFVEMGRAKLHVAVGQVYGAQSPVKTFSEMFYVEARMARGTELPMPDNYEERAIYVVKGSLQVRGQSAVPSVTPGALAVLRAGASVVVEAEQDAHFVLLGGEPLDGPRHLWWNFVHSSPERIEQAKRDWVEGRFPQVPGETEFIPLPEE